MIFLEIFHFELVVSLFEVTLDDSTKMFGLFLPGVCHQNKAISQISSSPMGNLSTQKERNRITNYKGSTYDVV